jgi:hypothetical protein
MNTSPERRPPQIRATPLLATGPREEYASFSVAMYPAPESICTAQGLTGLPLGAKNSSRVIQR